MLLRWFRPRAERRNGGFRRKHRWKLPDRSDFFALTAFFMGLRPGMTALCLRLADSVKDFDPAIPAGFPDNSQCTGTGAGWNESQGCRSVMIVWQRSIRDRLAGGITFPPVFHGHPVPWASASALLAHSYRHSPVANNNRYGVNTYPLHPTESIRSDPDLFIRLILSQPPDKPLANLREIVTDLGRCSRFNS